MENETKSPILYEEINLSQNDDTQFIYDENSHKFIIINKQTNEINIYSKKCQIFLLKRKLADFNFQNKTILKVTILRQNWCMILYLEEKVLQLLLIKLQEGKILSVFKCNNNDLIGLFFIDKENIQCPKLCAVYNNHIEYHQINEFKQTLDLIQRINIENKRLFTYYRYDPSYKILCVQRGDIENNDKNLVFHFYNLSNEKFYRKYSTLKITEKVDKKLIKKKSDKSGKNIKNYLVNNSPNFKISQFFMEKLYNKLYFIWLSYYEKKIKFYNLVQLDNITEDLSIEFSGNDSSLQFCDNLILLHDITLQKTTAFDFIFIDKQCRQLFPLYPFSPMTNKSNNNTNNNNDNESIYTNMTKIRGKIIYGSNPGDSCEKLYIVYFDPEIFYTCQKDRKAALYRISYRKNGKYFMLKTLEQALKYNCYPKIHQKSIPSMYHFRLIDVFLIFKIICFLIEKSQSMMAIYTAQFSKEKEEYTQVTQSFESLFPKKKNIISFDDFHYQTFKLFENDENTIPEKAIYFHILIKYELCKHSLKPGSAFYCTLIPFLKRIKHFHTIHDYFTCHYFGDTISLATFLIQDVYFNTDKGFSKSEKEMAFQLGIDMFHRMKKHVDMCEFFINGGFYNELFIVMKKYKIKNKALNESLKTKCGDVIKKFLNSG